MKTADIAPFFATLKAANPMPVTEALERVEAQGPAGFPQRVFKPIRAGMPAQAEPFIAGLP